MNKKIIYLLLTAVLLGSIFFWMKNKQESSDASCHDTTAHEGHQGEGVAMKSPANQALLDEVMAIHDEIMPKMGRLNELQQKMIDMAKASKDKNQKSSYQAMATELGRVSDSMFEWMEKFPENLDSLPEPQMKMILEEQKASISVMKEQMLNTLKKSDDIITNTKETNL
ncbi:MAG: hypothetical protein ACOYOA_08585 [Saprospiraceae bacterium]